MPRHHELRLGHTAAIAHLADPERGLQPPRDDHDAQDIGRDSQEDGQSYVALQLEMDVAGTQVDL
jgi:hypothetical protein